MLDAPLLATVAADFTGFPTPRALTDYIERHHADWPKHYRTVSERDADGKRRRRTRRYVLTSQLRALVDETFRSTYRRVDSAQARSSGTVIPGTGDVAS